MPGRRIVDRKRGTFRKFAGQTTREVVIFSQLSVRRLSQEGQYSNRLLELLEGLDNEIFLFHLAAVAVDRRQILASDAN